MKLNFLNKLLNWSLCLDAKFNRKTVWIYFACNIFLVMAALGSVILSCVVIFFYNAKEVLLIHLEYFVAIVFIWAIAHYFIDLFFCHLSENDTAFLLKKIRNRRDDGYLPFVGQGDGLCEPCQK